MTERFTVVFEVEIDDDSLAYFTEEPDHYLSCDTHFDSSIKVYPENPDSVGRKLAQYKNESY